MSQEERILNLSTRSYFMYSRSAYSQKNFIIFFQNFEKFREKFQKCVTFRHVTFTHDSLGWMTYLAEHVLTPRTSLKFHKYRNVRLQASAKKWWRIVAAKYGDKILFGYSDVGDNMMCSTYSWWHFPDFGYKIKVLVTFWRFYCLWDTGC